jgi:hypothetical protein
MLQYFFRNVGEKINIFHIGADTGAAVVAQARGGGRASSGQWPET